MFTVLIVRSKLTTESQPAAFGIMVVYVPVEVYTAPSGAVYESHADSVTELTVELFTVRSIVMILSQPTEFGSMAIYIPVEV